MPKRIKPTPTEPEYAKRIVNRVDPRLNFLMDPTWARVMGDDNLLVMFANDVVDRIRQPQVKKITKWEVDSQGDNFIQEYAACSVKSLRNWNMGIVWSEKTQTRLFNKLINLGYAKTIKIGIPPTRYVYIDVLKIEDDVDAYEYRTGRLNQ